MDVRTDLIAEIEAFCRASGIRETTFGGQAVNDGKFVGRLRAGKGVTLATVDRVRKFIAENRKARRSGKAA